MESDSLCFCGFGIFDYADFRFMCSQIRSYGPDESVSVFPGAFVGVIFVTLKSFYVLVKILWFNNLYL